MNKYIDVEKLLNDHCLHTLPKTCGAAAGRVVIFLEDIEKHIEHIPNDMCVMSQEEYQLAIAQERQRTINELFAKIDALKQACSTDNYGKQVPTMLHTQNFIRRLEVLKDIYNYKNET